MPAENQWVGEVNAYRSAPLKSRVHAKDDEIEARFDEYDHAFETDTLESIDEDPVMQRMRTDLQSLYNFKSKPFQALHELLIKECPFLYPIHPIYRRVPLYMKAS